ncbi:MAG: carboxylating nicotinate-nucleotide diphosphorylase [Rhodobacteraceae bacterium]|uniref:carboxylating nicotinate-nucleotide diphosphorylase n=1 Tax=Amaricoccus sp. B4 TaxID=3368557 RepID=UPI000DABE831|nr:carboxylating nicotinate-nucleotide diphosphorylase [Paracoccaceae bacterium]
MRTAYNTLPDLMLEPLVRNALLEDLGLSGDVTTRAVIPYATTWQARMVAREPGIVSGMQIAALAFRLVDAELDIRVIVPDGAPCAPGDLLMEITGRAHSLLQAERVALNFAGRMAGIATQTAAFAAETRGTDARIACTRKTTPGLRIIEKQAVIHGGGHPHRYSLGDAVLIKDNHIAAAGGVREVLEAAHAVTSHMMRIEIEVDRLDQLEEVIAAGGADVVLLDNMDTETMRRAVEMVDRRMITEASGNMRLERIAAVAATGVDYISVGALTHSVRTLDLGLDF